MDLALASGIAALGEGWTLVPAGYGVEVFEVLVEQSQGGIAAVDGAVPGHHGLRSLDQGSEPRERGAVVVE